MRALNLVVERTNVVLLVAAGIVLIMMMFHIVADVASKYLFSSPIIGTTEIVAWYYMVAVSMLPVAYVQMQRAHLVVEMFTMNLSVRTKAWMDSSVAVVSSGYTGLLSWLLWKDAVRSTARGRAQDLTWFDLPTWPSAWILPIAFGLLTLVFLLQALADLQRATSGA